MISSLKITVGTEPTLLTYPETVDSIKGQTLAIKNSGGSSVYLGGADVTVESGYSLADGEQLAVEFSTLQDLYAISEGSVDLSILYLDVK